MKVIIGSDHAGKEIRKKVIEHLKGQQIEVVDCGTNNDTSNYAIEGIKVAENISMKKGDLGIIICGSGVGISIAANKVKGVRAALVYNEEVAKLAREHNDANVISIGARFFNLEEIIKMVDVFISTDFEGGRHANIVNKIACQ